MLTSAPFGPAREGLCATLTAVGVRHPQGGDRDRAVLLGTPTFPPALGRDGAFLADCVRARRELAAGAASVCRSGPPAR
jgi:hypothetical protein